jgi:hypothetical protein
MEHVNHRLRNALAPLVSPVRLKRDPELIQATQDAANRIDWTLLQVL